MCPSLRGGTYYGASLHITIGILFLGGFFVDLLGVAEIWHNPYATYFSLILAFIYILLFIVFGILVFRGVETESGKLLKGSIAGFVALQISAFLVYLIILAITSTIKNSRRLSHPKPTSSSDLSEIEAILEEASAEFKQNQSSIPEIAYRSTASPDSIDLLVTATGVSDDEPIISIYQVIVIIFGAVGTIAYASVVIMYIGQINSNNIRIRAPVVRY